MFTTVAFVLFEKNNNKIKNNMYVLNASKMVKLSNMYSQNDFNDNERLFLPYQVKLLSDYE